MTWLSLPTGLILAAAVIPPLLLLYFLKLRRRTQPIASTLLWQRSIEDLHANAPFQRLRRSLLLFLQLLALILLVIAVMQPQIQSTQRRGGKTILLIDHSASMTATDGPDGVTRLDDAKQRAKARIEALYSGGMFTTAPGETMIIAFADDAEIASRFSNSKRELLAAIDSIQPSHGGTSLQNALKLARAYMTNVDPDSQREVAAAPALEIFTDGRIADLDEQVLRGEQMLYHPSGTVDADNVSISAISVERPFDRPAAIEVFASLSNLNPTEITCDVQLAVDGTALRIEEITLPPATVDTGTGMLVAGRKSVSFSPFDQPRDAVLEVTNLREDDLRVDNAARIVVPPPKELLVAVVPETSFFARKALEGLTLRGVRLLSTDEYEAMAREGGLEIFDVIVFENYAPPEDLLAPGRYLMLGGTPPLPGLNPYGRHDAQLVLDADEAHPILHFVNLDNLLIGTGTLVRPDEELEVLVEGSEGPLVVASLSGRVKAVYVSFDPAESNWPLLRSFVTFMFNAMDYLGNLGEGLTSKSLEVGDAITARLPPAARRTELILPTEERLDLETLDGERVGWGPIRLGGLYTLEWEEPDQTGKFVKRSRPFAVNMTNSDEAVIAARASLVIGQERVDATARDAASYRPLWPWALGLALGVLMLEWWVYHRRAFL